MFCRYCGKEIDNTAKFCNYCGKGTSENKKEICQSDDVENEQEQLKNRRNFKTKQVI